MVITALWKALAAGITKEWVVYLLLCLYTAISMFRTFFQASTIICCLTKDSIQRHSRSVQIISAHLTLQYTDSYRISFLGQAQTKQTSTNISNQPTNNIYDSFNSFVCLIMHFTYLENRMIETEKGDTNPFSSTFS